MARGPIQAQIGQARAILQRYIELARSPRRLMEAAAEAGEFSTRSRFDTSSGPGGVPWPVSRRAQAGGGKTLVDKGGLLSSITSRATDHTAEWGVMAKTQSARFAAVHQFGMTILPKRGPSSVARSIGRDIRHGRTRKATGFLVFKGADGKMVFARSVTIPARPFLGIDEADREVLMEVWTAELEALKQ